jgi:hypothetical protein
MDLVVLNVVVLAARKKRPIRRKKRALNGEVIKEEPTITQNQANIAVRQ